MFTYKNTETNETKEVITAESFVIADEYFGCKYWYLNEKWVTVEIFHTNYETTDKENYTPCST